MRFLFSASASAFTCACVCASLLACGGAPLAPAGSTGETDSGASTVPSTHDSGTTGPGNPVPGTDAGTTPDAAVSPGADSGGGNGPDGPPTRQACTSSFGSALSATHGRLDGTLVAIVQPGTHSCNGDSSHLHLQILMGGSVYDVATNLDTYFYETDMAMPDGAFAEGWHPGDSLDYPKLGVHSTQFTVPASPSALAATVTTALENANHLSVFALGYGPTGIHDVHKRTGGTDGAIVIDPLSATSHMLFFCFNTDTF